MRLLANLSPRKKKNNFKANIDRQPRLKGVSVFEGKVTFPLRFPFSCRYFCYRNVTKLVLSKRPSYPGDSGCQIEFIGDNVCSWLLSRRAQKVTVQNSVDDNL